MKRRTKRITILLITSTLLLGGLLALRLTGAQFDAASPGEEVALPVWAEVEMIDAVSGNAFKISDYSGRPILIESFAVWCSTCLRQQREMARLIELAGDAIVHISIDTDPNENLSKVREHVLLHEFSWLYAVAPIELTQALISEFGLTVVNAPRSPVILIEADGTARLLPNGVKSAEMLLEQIGELDLLQSEDGNA